MKNTYNISTRESVDAVIKEIPAGKREYKYKYHTGTRTVSGTAADRSELVEVIEQQRGRINLEMVRSVESSRGYAIEFEA